MQPLPRANAGKSVSHAVGPGVLIVDDDEVVSETVAAVLAPLGRPVHMASDAEEAKRIVGAGFQGVVLLDLGLPGTHGLALVEPLRAIAPSNPIIVLTAKDDIASIVEAMQHGVQDFIVKGQAGFADRLQAATRMALAEIERHRRELEVPPQSAAEREPLVWRSPAMRDVLSDVSRLANSRVHVLITGPSGVGKEVVAHAIHAGGQRRGRPFVAVNCAGIPDSLLESELLGYERGAFTGALARKPGKFEVADSGTIFLDEIGEMSMPLQAKLLRVLQDGGFERLGGNQTVRVDVRVLSATNRDLSQMVREGSFREDLYYRLAVFTLTLPPLRERRSDVAPLVEHFLRRACAEEHKPVPTISREVSRLLEMHTWPGNVRQLQNVVKHAVVMMRGDTLTIGDLPASFLQGLHAPVEGAAATSRGAAKLALDLAVGTAAERLERSLSAAFPDDSLLPTMEELEAAGIRLAMSRLAGNRKQTAERLQISRATLYRRIEPEGRRRTGEAERDGEAGQVEAGPAEAVSD